MTSRLHLTARRLAHIGLALILVLVPFHAFLSIWATSLSGGGYELWQIWKEILLLALLPVVAYLLWRRRAYWHELDTRWIFWASVAYLALHLSLGLLALARGEVNTYALAYALVVNLRFLLIFWLCLICAAQSPWLRRHWKRLVVIPAAAVVVFGLLQYVALPADFLKHFGYGPGTIMPYDTVDQKMDYARVQSFLRGSNPLGAYMLIVLPVMLVGVWRFLRPFSWQGAARLALAVTGAIVLVATFSRSAYLGCFAALLALTAYAYRRHLTWPRLAAAAAAVVVFAAGTLVVFRDNDSFQNIVFHTDEHSRSSLSSNAGRLGALQGGITDVATEPFGRGPGTAGPASLHNVAPGRLAENYYLQIGQEVGWLGLGLFIALNVLVGIKLWGRRDDVLARLLLASLIGLTVVNMLSHAWTDDTVSLLWWGLAGIALAPAILPKPEVPPKRPRIRK